MANIGKLLKGLGVGAGLGAGAMYLGNEGEGETFTSYPKESRGKRLLKFEEVPFSEKLMYKTGLEDTEKLDRFGYGIEKEKPDILEWSKKPWDMDQDIPLMKEALISIAQEFHPDKKPFYVPSSSWEEQRNKYFSTIVKHARNKEGFPEDMSLKDFGITDEEWSNNG